MSRAPCRRPCGCCRCPEAPIVILELTLQEEVRLGVRRIVVGGRVFLLEHHLKVKIIDLVRLNVDVIVAPSPPYIIAARQATSSIPIVFALPGDPVGDGFVASLARPGGNLTGLTSVGDDLVRKQLELLKEAIPSATRIAVLCDWETNKADKWRGDLETAARLLKIQLNILEVRDPAQLDAAFSTMVRERSDAVMVMVGVYMYPHRSRIAELAMQHQLPSMLNIREYVEAGGLMVYSANSSDLMSRSATYVDKILKGAKPADLPVEQPTKLKLTINLVWGDFCQGVPQGSYPFFVRQFLCSTCAAVSSSRPTHRRAGARRGGQGWPHLRGHRRLGIGRRRARRHTWRVGMTKSEGSPRVVHEGSCHILVFGGREAQTMMQ
jgi:hypothetical protein